MRSPFHAALAVSAALMLTLSACGGSAHHAAKTGGGASMPAMTGTSTAPGAGPPVATDQVSIKNFAFVPATVTVHTGATMTWTNADQEQHTVTSLTGVFRSPVLSTTSTFHYTFTKPGTYHYQCTIHPFMRGTVVVAP